MSAPAKRVETIRFAKPQSRAEPKPKPQRHTGILQDQLRRSFRGPWCPSFSVAFRLIILMRVCAAMYSNISDCDEVFNFWEPLHYLDQGYGFQTWEVSPAYAIRSWAYIALHLMPLQIPRLLSADKRASFFCLRLFFALISSLAEAKFYRTVVERINERVGRYLLLFMLFSTGMWSASTAFLPSTFAMFTNLLAFSYAFDLPSRINGRRTLFATLMFSVGAIVGAWPFALAVALPFVVEELCIYGQDKIKKEVMVEWFAQRTWRLIKCGAVASLLFIPVIAIDTLAYGKLTIVPWNIVKYNVFGNQGPSIYGTEPWYFYILNLVLNFNLVLPLALVALPSLAITYVVDYRRLGIAKSGPDESSPYSLLAMRVAPVYVWLAIFTCQPHKEERFMFPIYPLICFNAAVTLYLVRGWIEVAYIKISKSPYQASRTHLFRNVTSSVLILASLISVSRIFALNHYYHAPLDVALHLEYKELPRLLNVTNLIIQPPPPDPTSRRSSSRYDDQKRVDLSPLKTFGGLRLCLGKEWYQFPGHYLIPNGVQVEFIKSEFDGLLPGHFAQSTGTHGRIWKREKTREIPAGMNNKNQEEPSHVVDVNTCDYLIDVDFPLRPSSSRLEPRYVLDTAKWDRVVCFPYLDAQNSGRLTRLLWLPGSWWANNGAAGTKGNKFGEYCLLRDKVRAQARESKNWGPV